MTTRLPMSLLEHQWWKSCCQCRCRCCGCGCALLGLGIHCLQVGGQGHSDMEWLEPGLPSDCDCTLCGPTDHIKWETVRTKMRSPRTFTAMAGMEVAGSSLVLMVGGDQDPDLPRSTLEIFNRKTESWSAGPDTLHRRDSCRLVCLEGESRSRPVTTVSSMTYFRSFVRDWRIR